MRKTVLILLALGLGAASAQQAPIATVQNVALTDVPAGHWAREAVSKLSACGLIKGFPEGTFRGNENLTRYQAAMIFHRLLSNEGLTGCGLSQPDMTMITKGMQEVAPELAAIANRLNGLEAVNAEQAARIAALEERIAKLSTGNTDAALADRVTALEAAVRNIPAGPQGPQGPAGPQGPVGPQGPAGPAGAAAPAPMTSATITPSTPATGSNSTVVVTPVTKAVTAAVNNVATAVKSSDLYAAATLGVSMTDKTKPCSLLPGAKQGIDKPFCLSAGGIIGSDNLFAGVGARVAADYNLGNGSFSADLAATYKLPVGLYVGAGVGMVNSKTHHYIFDVNNNPVMVNNTTPVLVNNKPVYYNIKDENVTDLYALGLVGGEYRLSSNIGLFAEGNVRYFLSNKGYGTGLQNSLADGKGVNFGAKLGAKFYF